MMPNIAGNAALAVAMVLAIAVVLFALAARLTRQRRGGRTGKGQGAAPAHGPDEDPGDPRP